MVFWFAPARSDRDGHVTMAAFGKIGKFWSPEPTCLRGIFVFFPPHLGD